MKRILLPLMILCATFAYGEVTFSNLDLSPDNVLLFQAETDAPAFGHFSTLFTSNLDSKTLNQLTFFPEQIMLVGNRNELQIQNRFGVFRTDAALSNMAPVPNFPAFVTGADIQTGKIAATSASPDGRYLLYLRPVDFGHADLELYTISDGSIFTVAKDVELTLSGPQAAWSPSSTYFVYASGGTVYYFAVDQLVQHRVVDASLRAIGPGTIKNVKWTSDGGLFYVNGSLVYRIDTADLFTRSLYSSLMSTGSIIGKIPFPFDSSFDDFWVSPDGNTILLDKEGRNVFLYSLRGDDYLSSGQTQSYPYLLLPRNTRVQQVLWSTDGIVTLLTSSIIGSDSKSAVFRLNLFAPGVPLFQRTSDTGARSIVLNSDGSRAIVLYPDRVVIRDYRSWSDELSISEPDPLSALWLSSSQIIVAGGWFTDLMNLTDNSTRLISLSQPGQYGFDASTGRVTVRSHDRTYALAGAVAGGLNWESIPAFNEAPRSVASAQYRVYVDTAQSGIYANIVMVRSVQGEGTRPLFAYPSAKYEAFPTTDEPVSFTDFTHGSRIRRREVALVFNAIDSVDGLTSVLNTLHEYNLRCTFFVNGEFMRRNPDAVREIADSGQEVGSLFFAYFDMTDARFNLDANFIKQGLARNEDDYYALTGKELSLLWHAPYYFASSRIIQAASQLNYTYIGRDVDPLDWVTKNDAYQGVNIYLSTSDIINRVMKLKEPGSIIPIRIGKTNGEREDYLWNRLDVLINDLMTLGYSIVPVSTLMEHAR
ncbi:MAG TPA: polysaccharide deacetylase family protein [Spirochaetia bacterium]|nr:polysaccharide deacetylase family protein [Spirochaetia bacterium]